MIERDKFDGTLLGLAVGDALGTTLEFKAPGSFEPIDDMTGGGPFALKAGEWTDDTSMALCLAESLVECDGFSPSDQMDRYIRWWRDGHMSVRDHCFDIGMTVSDALHRYLQTGKAYAGSTDPMSAGNGSVMRLAPVAMFYCRDREEAIDHAINSSRTTHGTRTCLDASALMASLLISAMQDVDKLDLMPHALEQLNVEGLSPEVRAIAQGSYLKKSPPEIRGTGYVVESLEAALWAFYSTDNFRDGALAAVNLGDDADTTGAIFGQIAGAFYGKSDIPSPWLETLAMRDLIEGLIERLYAASCGRRS